MKQPEDVQSSKPTRSCLFTWQGQEGGLCSSVTDHGHFLGAHADDRVRPVVFSEAGGESLVRFYVGAHHGAVNGLEEGLNETIHPVVKLVVSQSLKNKTREKKF